MFSTDGNWNVEDVLSFDFSFLASPEKKTRVGEAIFESKIANASVTPKKVLLVTEGMHFTSAEATEVLIIARPRSNIRLKESSLSEKRCTLANKMVS